MRTLLGARLEKEAKGSEAKGETEMWDTDGKKKRREDLEEKR